MTRILLLSPSTKPRETLFSGLQYAAMPSQWRSIIVGELLVGLEALPLERGAPVVEEAPRPAFALVAPELAEGLLEQVGRVQPLVGGEQHLQRLAALQREVLAAGQQGVLLALDEAPVLAGEPRVLALADLVERLPEMAHDVELVEQDRRLRRVRACVALRNGFHMSITASRMRRLFFSPSQA